MSTREVFETAAEIVEAGWCQNSMAQNEHGQIVDVTMISAQKFCVMGAVIRAASICKMDDEYVLVELNRYIARQYYGVELEGSLLMLIQSGKLSVWNDEEGRTKEEVAAMLRTVGKQISTK